MRLINADALKEMIPTTSVDMFENCRNCSLLSEEQVNELIDMTPTIDAVEVVRCKDCIYYDSDMICNVTDTVCDNDDYCSYGESRKDGE